MLTNVIQSFSVKITNLIHIWAVKINTQVTKRSFQGCQITAVVTLSHFFSEISDYCLYSSQACVRAPSCPTLCDPTDCSPPSSLRAWDSPGKNAWAGCQRLLQWLFPTQRWNPRLPWLLFWQAGSLPLRSAFYKLSIKVTNQRNNSRSLRSRI